MLYTVYRLKSGFWLHQQGEFTKGDFDALGYRPVQIRVQSKDHIDAYIKAGIPPESIHSLYRDNVEQRLVEEASDET